MNYCIYKMRFQSGVHFGENSLDGTNSFFCADTLFSALCTEALKDSRELLNSIYGYVKSNELCFSDAFPFIENEYLLPKPMIRIEAGEDGSQGDKKQFKKMGYIALSYFDDFVKGNLDPDKELVLEKRIGRKEVKTSASIRGLGETLPYRVGVFSYLDTAGLYVIVGYSNDEARELFDSLIEKLSYSGIGGKRTAGLGRFDLFRGKMVDPLPDLLERETGSFMSLSVSLPREDELEKVVDGASYLLNKRSGFVSSADYSDAFLRKRDLFVFKSGCVFKTRFSGDIYDVSENGSHPVYRYAKPLFIGI